MKHSTREDERGWYSYPTGTRNLLNKSGAIGQGRRGTLGSRLSDGTRNRAQRHNPRIGKVQPEAPITKRAQLMLGAQEVETWATSHATPDNGRTPIVHEWRGTVYATWQDMQDAIAAQ